MPRQARALAARIGHLASCTEPRTRPRAATAAISWFASNVLSGSAGFMMPIARPHGGCDSDRSPPGAVHETPAATSRLARTAIAACTLRPDSPAHDQGCRLRAPFRDRPRRPHRKGWEVAGAGLARVQRAHRRRGRDRRPAPRGSTHAPARPGPCGFGALMQQFKAQRFRGLRLRLSA